MRTLGGVAAATLLLAACGSEQPTRRASDPVSASIGEISRCHTGQLSPSVMTSGSTMSQPFVTVVLRNEGAQTCWVKGYPVVGAAGHREGGPTRPLRIDVHHGSVYERRDPGLHQVVVPSQEAASFTVGTATAYDGGDSLVITGLRITLPGPGPAITLPVSLDASSPSHRPIPVRITALERNAG